MIFWSAVVYLYRRFDFSADVTTHFAYPWNGDERSKREEVTFVMMKKLVVLPLVAALMILPLTGCESKKLKEENASLKQQVDSLTQEKNGLAAKADELSKANADLQAKVGDLEKKVEELSKPKPAAKAPAKKTTTRKR